MKRTTVFPSRTIICGPHARDDVLRRLVDEEDAVLGVDVLPFHGFITGRLRRHDHRAPLRPGRIRLEVLRILAEGGTAFDDDGLADEPATRRAVAAAVTRLLGLPPGWRGRHDDARLPREIARIAGIVADRTRADHITWGEAVELVCRAEKGVEIDGWEPADAVEEHALSLLRDGAGRETGDRDDAPAIPAAVHPDPTTEVLAMVSELRAELARGVPPAALAVAAPDPAYLPLIEDALARAGIGYRGPTSRCWLDRPLIGDFLALLELDPEQLPRRELAAAAGGGRLAGIDHRALDRLTRGGNLPVTGGADWGDPALRERDAAGTLDAIGALRGRLRRLGEAGGWEELCEGITGLLSTVLSVGEEDADDEALLRRAVADLAAQSAGLPPARMEAAAELLREGFERPLPGHSEPGPLVGGLDVLIGRDLEHAWILGATDRVLPGRRVVDPCITERQLGHDPREDLVRRRRQLSAAVAAARETTVSLPHTIPGEPGVHPSPWVRVRDDAAAGSWPARIIADGAGHRPVSPADLSLAGTILAGPEGDDLLHLVHASRLAGEASEWNGFPAGDAPRRWLTDPRRRLSASALSDYLDSPQAFLFTRVLRADMLDDPDPAADIDARAGGTLIHGIIEEWTRRTWLEAPEPRPRGFADVDWDAAWRLLEDIARERMDAHPSGNYERVLWRARRDAMLDHLAAWFEQERREAEAGWVPIAVEAVFGTDDAPATLSVTLPEGSEPAGLVLNLRGAIDRVDRNLHTGEIRLTDYKTGKSEHYQTLPGWEDDKEVPTGPMIGSAKQWRLQLALYAEVVRNHPELVGLPGDAEPAISTRYWFLPERADGEDPRFRGGKHDDAGSESLRHALSTLLGGVLDGRFPPTSLQFGRDPAPQAARLGGPLLPAYAEAAQAAGLHPFELAEEND